MVESRWFRRAGPVMAALTAAAWMASSATGAAERPWDPPPCREQPALSEAGGGAWFQLDPIIEAGRLQGQRVSLGWPGAERPQVIELQAESFAAGPFGGLILVGSDDGARSTLSLVDIAHGCSWDLGSARDVVRRATIARDGTLYDVRVARHSRADLGVWRRPLDSDTATRVLAPLPPDARFGRTWSTELTWSMDGSLLAIGSCGEIACRTRVLDPLSGRVRYIADAELGDVVGLTSDRLVVHGACRGLPCPLVSVRMDDGGQTVLDDAAGNAVMSQTDDGAPLVTFEQGAGGRHLRTIDVEGHRSTELEDPPEGLRLVPAAARSGAAADIDPAWVLFGPGGRLRGDAAARSLLRHLPGDRLVPLDEVSR